MKFAIVFALAVVAALPMSARADSDTAKEVPFLVCAATTVVNPLVGAGCFVVGWLSLASYEAGKQNR